MVTICHSSIDERGKASGGTAGDQTGKEVCTRGWYSKNWKIVFRYKDSAIAKKVAAIAKKLADSSLVGYDQEQRNTLYQALEKFNWDVDAYIKSGIKTECDCSSFVYACWCCLVAALRKSGNAPTTSTLSKTFTEKNGFTALEDSKYLTSDNYLLTGDVIDNPGSHVIMAITDGDKATTNNKSENTKNDIKPVDKVDANVESTIWNFFKDKKLNDFAIAGIMGNMYAESGLSHINLQNNGNTKLGLTDAEYTAQVDSGKYTNFIKDSYGYGLVQWTYYTRKEGLYNYAKSKHKSIGTLSIQLEYLWTELTVSYKGCYNKLVAAKSILEASNAFLFDFERPKDQSKAVQDKRAEYGKVYYDKFAKNTISEPSKPPVAPKYTVGKSYTLMTELNVRTGAGTGFPKKSWSQLTTDGKKHDVDKDGALDKGTVVTCQEIKNVGNDIWMRVPSGWLAAYYKNQYYIK